MKVGVLSGKGGAGKTLVSVNLASVEENTTYFDCDVEEPNGHLFLKPENIMEESITIKIPEVDTTLCNGCRVCTEFCNFNALAYTKNKVIVFEEVCHSCGGCSLLCNTKAIKEKDKVIGRVEEGLSGHIKVITGWLNIGEVTGVPIINHINEKAKKATGNVFIDCPPGSGCSVMESIKEVDYCIIVVEPTIFGLHNMKMVYELVTKFNKPVGMVINKSLDEKNPITDFCIENNIKVLGNIPFDPELSKINSNGLISSNENSKYRKMFMTILSEVKKEVENETIAHS